MNLAIEKKIVISECYILDILSQMGLMERKPEATYISEENEKKAKKFLTRFLRSLGYTEIEWK